LPSCSLRLIPDFSQPHFDIFQLLQQTNFQLLKFFLIDYERLFILLLLLFFLLMVALFLLLLQTFLNLLRVKNRLHNLASRFDVKSKILLRECLPKEPLVLFDSLNIDPLKGIAFNHSFKKVLQIIINV
jgi:hypothetical protein